MAARRLDTRRPRQVRTLVGGLLLVLVLLASGCSGHGRPAASAPTTAPTPAPVQAVVEHLDAHDGGIVQAGSMYYEFGTSYDCGFQFGIAGTRFCGISIYSSTNLREWTSRGQAFDPDSTDWQQACTPGGCFRPHVVFNRASSTWVMWINVFSGTYRVLTSPSPTGPWSLVRGAGAVATPSGDENLFVDGDGTGYLIRTDLDGKKATTKTHELEVDRLDSSYTHVTGATSRPTIGFVEAPTMWTRGGVYYLAYSDPACPYCTATGTSVTTAPTPLGPWSTPYSLSGTSCHGQPTQVSALNTPAGAVDLYQSDNWVRLGSDHITRNQKLATQTWVPLVYDGTRPRTLSCP